MLQEALKAATKENHDELENLMFVNEIMNKSLRPGDYLQILATNYIVHKIIEPKIEAALAEDAEAALQLNNRLKLNALKTDAIEAGLDTEELDAQAVCFQSIDFNNDSALGALYVLEGATLGGNVIQKKLKKTPGFEAYGLHYYTFYQDQLMNNWITFVKTLNCSGADSASVIEGAKNTFDFIASVARQQRSLLK